MKNLNNVLCILSDFNYSAKLIKSLESKDLSIKDLVDFTNKDFKGKGFFEKISAKQVFYEITELANTVKESDPKIIMEIGTYRGGTLFLWCNLNDTVTDVISVDLPDNFLTHPYSFVRRIFYKRNFLLNKSKKLFLLPYNSQIKTTRDKVEDILKDRKIDFLFIDGDHSYKGVQKDFELYLPLMKKGGIIAFHDILPREDVKEIEVYRLWNELKQKYKFKEIISADGKFADTIGIGVIWV